MTQKAAWLLIAIVCGSSVGATGDDGFQFLATGDTPYSQQQEVKFRRLLKQAAGDDFAFLMHVGDIKAGGDPCSDEAFANIRDLFRSFPTPVVYTPGDNEWTDCHQVAADPRERLERLRGMFFADDSVLRLSQLGAESQARVAGGLFSENYRFVKSNVLFVVVNICGSKNNRRLDDQASMNEYRERTAANLAFLRDSFRNAQANEVAGVAVVIHANPNFELGLEPGFHQFNSLMQEFLGEYAGPVLCIHGDSHYFRIDKPLRSAVGEIYFHFTRLEVFGSPNVAGVTVTVDPTDAQVFSFRPYYVDD